MLAVLPLATAVVAAVHAGERPAPAFRLWAVLGCAAGAVLVRDRPGLVVIRWALVLALPAVRQVGLLPLPRVNGSADACACAVLRDVASGSQFLGLYFWYGGLVLRSIVRIGQVQLLQTFLTLGCSAMLLGERVDKFTLIFALATVLCLCAGRRAPA